jgi:excisionase family DNA binding protein
MEPIENQIMTAQEVAQYLRLDVATVYKLAQAGEIPGVKVGRTWRFDRGLMDEWFRNETERRMRLEE